MTKRKFYKAVFQFTVLSETPFDGNETPKGLAESTESGDDVGQFDMFSQETLNGKQAVKELYNLNSEAGFFRLDDDGNDTED